MEWEEIGFLERLGRSIFFVQHGLYRVRPYHETDTHTFIHAKYNPELPIDRQPTWLLRLEFAQRRYTWPAVSGKFVSPISKRKYHIEQSWPGRPGGLLPRAPTDPDLWSKKLISSHLLDPPPKCL